MNIWQRIENTDYFISNDGQIKGKKGLMMANPISIGYRRATLSVNGKKVYKYIHRLVAEAFIPNPENMPQINHIDGNKLNNHVNNLEWGNQSQNVSHAVEMGLLDNKGSKHGMSKLTEIQVKDIRERLAAGMTGKSIAERYNVSRSVISEIKNRKSWNHV